MGRMPTCLSSATRVHGVNQRYDIRRKEILLENLVLRPSIIWSVGAHSYIVYSACIALATLHDESYLISLRRGHIMAW